MTGAWEIALHNVDVRQLVYSGERHPQLSDDWSDTHFVTVTARSATDARQKIEMRYPRDRGFIIESVQEA